MLEANPTMCLTNELPIAAHNLGVDSPFFPAIVLFKNQPFPGVLGGFLERTNSLERMEMEVTPSKTAHRSVAFQVGWRPSTEATKGGRPGAALDVDEGIFSSASLQELERLLKSSGRGSKLNREAPRFEARCPCTEVPFWGCPLF